MTREEEDDVQYQISELLSDIAVDKAEIIELQAEISDLEHSIMRSEAEIQRLRDSLPNLFTASGSRTP